MKSVLISFSIGCVASLAAPGDVLSQGAARDGCDCGSAQFHSGVDWSAKEGTPVPVADDGVVVKVEENEGALVYTAMGGYCGRYVVVRHDYPAGKSVFTRYAQLGRLSDKDGKPVREGLRVKRQDKIGEVGKKALFHFEIRPLDEKNVERGPNWPLVYAADPAMLWAKYLPVDAAKFDFDVMRRPTGR